MKIIKRSAFTFVCLFCMAIGLFAQDEIRVTQFRSSALIPVSKPFIIDSLNINKKEYNDKDLLQTQVNLDKVRKSKSILTTDTAGIIPLEYAKDKAIQLLAFNIDADRHCKTKLEITSTEMFEVYINGKKEKSKESKETEIGKSSPSDLTLSLEPRRYEIILKILSSYKNFNQAELKARLIPDKQDSLAQLQVSVNEKRRITIYDIIEGRRVTDAKISFSGKYFTAGYENVDKTGKRTSEYELRDLKSNQLLYRFPSSIRPYWMPSSDRIYYWIKGSGENDFYIMDVASLEEKAIVKDIKISTVVVSPDEKFMLVHQREDVPVEKSDLKRYVSPSERAGTFKTVSSIFKYDFGNETFEKLSFGKTHAYATDISNDGKKILFMTLEEDLGQRGLTNRALYMMNLENSTLDTLCNDRFISDASFSPDAKKLLILGSGEAFDHIGLNILEGQISNTYDTQAYIMDMGTKKVTAITKDFNPSISNALWSVFDGKIYLQAEDEDRESVFMYDEGSKQFEKLVLKEDIIKGFGLSKKASTAIYRGQSVSNSYRLYSYDTKSKSVSMLSDPYGERLSEIELGEVKDWNFTSSGGTLIKGRYYLPPHFDATKKYPVIVYYYGGTTPTSRTFESRYPLHVFASLGYVVYTLQPSGTIGFGQEFSARHVNAWGNPTASEIIEGVKQFCKENTFTNGDKIACIGASYGGFMTQYLLTQTDIFSAAISHAGISALSSYWGEGYWGYAYSDVASAGSYPWNNPELYVEQSPLFHADKINTPLLLLHGSVDTNVPIGESIQMYTALKLLGKPVEFIQVDGENHAIAAYKKRVDWSKTIYAWFAKWLNDQPQWWDTLYPGPK